MGIKKLFNSQVGCGLVVLGTAALFFGAAFFLMPHLVSSTAAAATTVAGGKGAMLPATALITETIGGAPTLVLGAVSTATGLNMVL